MQNEQVTINIFFSNCRNKRSQCYDRWKNFFDQPYDNIRKIATSQKGDLTTSCLLDYVYFRNYYKMIAIDLIKQKAFDVDPKAIKQTNFTLR